MVFNSNLNILNTLRQFSLKIAIHYRKTLFEFIPKYFSIRNSSFQENAKTKVYALEDSLGVVWTLGSDECSFYCFFFQFVNFVIFRHYTIINKTKIV